MSKYPMVKLVDCINVFNNPITKFNGKKKYIATGDLLNNRINYERLEEFDYNNKPSRANLTANVGDILFAKMKNTKKTFIISNLESSYMFSTGFFCITPKDIIDKKYLFHIVNNDIFLSQKDIYCTGATQKALTLKGLNKIIIPLPQIEEQRHIANVLDKVTTQIDNCKKILSNLDLLVKSKFVQMFGDPVSNPMGWIESTIGKECYYIKDGPHKSLQNIGRENGGYPFISVRNIVNGYIDFSTAKYISDDDYNEAIKKCHPKKGDMLYSKGGTTGIAKLIDIDEPFANWVHVAVLKFDKSKLNGIFFENMLNIDYCYQQSQMLTKGIANRDLVLSAMTQIKIYRPPIELQNQFAEFVENVEKQKTTTQNTLNQLETLKNALMQEYFS